MYKIKNIKKSNITSKEAVVRFISSLIKIEVKLK
jgi:hypothetical protein